MVPAAFRLLHRLSNIELKKLQSYLTSSFFSHRPGLLNLVDSWRKARGQGRSATYHFTKVFPQRAFAKRDWYLLLSRTQEATERFLGLQSFQQDELGQRLYRLRALRSIQAPEFFERSFRQAQKLREKRERSEAAMLLWDYEIALEYYDYVASPKRTERTNLQDVSDSLDHFFIAEKLRQACLANSRSLVNQESYDIRYLAAILADLAARPALMEIPAIVVYASCYRAVASGRQKADFHHLRQVIEQYHTGFPNSEIRDIYLLAINFCIRAMNEGQVGFLAETHALYQESLAGGYLLEDGQLPESTFTNMVALGLKLKNFESIAHFITTYAKDLPAANRESVVHFNLARLHHAQGELDKALQALVLVSTRAPYLYLGAKSLQLRIFFAHQEWEALDSLLDQLRVYLQRRNDLGYRGDNYRLFLRFLRQFIQIRKNEKEAFILLRQKILAAPAFAEKEWLLLQIGI